MGLRSVCLHLFGGIKTRVASGIREIRSIGRAGREGFVNEIEISIAKNGRAKKRRFAEKTFFDRQLSHLGKPVEKFRVIKALAKLNREKKLGLKIVPTIRLRFVEKNDWRIITTILPIEESVQNAILRSKIFSRSELAPTVLKKMKEFTVDMERQQSVAQMNGYLIHNSAFVPVLRKGAKKVEAVIVDIGHIVSF
ncbi:MAG: hypothetical protein WC308_01440 [archaeon]|jgi:hypothetical protein